MDNWLLYLAIAFVVVMLVGNFSVFNRGAKRPMRKQPLNALKETLPRSNKSQHKMPTINGNNHAQDSTSNTLNKKNSD